MAAEEILRSKSLYKVTIFTLKIIPMLLAICDIVNTLLYMWDINAEVLSYFGGVSFLTLVFLYLASYVFRFCEYHRLPLHYVVITNIISIIDYNFSIGLAPAIYLTIAGIFIVLLVYLHQRNGKRVNRYTAINHK